MAKYIAEQITKQIIEQKGDRLDPKFWTAKRMLPWTHEFEPPKN